MSPDKEPPKDFRPQFTNDLHKMKNSTDPKAKHSKLTVCLVSQMNDQMVSNNVPMTEAHYDICVGSLNNGDKLCDFMRKENNEVINSNGSGLAYEAGKKAHEFISFMGWGKPPDKSK